MTIYHLSGAEGQVPEEKPMKSGKPENLPGVAGQAPESVEAGGATASKSPILVKLDRHEARHTPASTRWAVEASSGENLSILEAVERGLIEPLFTIHHAAKTHWFEYYYVDPGITLVRVRTTNLGNVKISKFRPEFLQPSAEEKEVLLKHIASEEYGEDG